jgi:hypothetical protein
MLLDVAHHKLDFEIVRVRSCDFIQPEEDRLQVLQLSHPFDLLVQTL